MNKKTITVNGTLYDTVTGMPIKKQVNNRATTSPEQRQSKTSHQVHRKVEQSRTSARKETPTSLIQKRRAMVQPNTKHSQVVTKFAPHTPVSRHTQRSMNDIRPAETHPIAKRAEDRLRQTHSDNQKVAHIKPSAVIKNEAINKALGEATAHHKAAKHVKHPKKSQSKLRFASIALSLFLLAGYFTYINLPNVSVRVAANQAGIDASYPGYKPDGYRLAGVNYDTGSVTLKFAANAGPQSFTITQQQTNWDSTAVRENYVKSHWGDAVVPYSERGLTIYAHDGNAAWVNGGILYTITGDATLSTSQVRNIATSL